jgi:hypothetical protein
MWYDKLANTDQRINTSDDNIIPPWALGARTRLSHRTNISQKSALQIIKQYAMMTNRGVAVWLHNSYPQH